MGAVSWGGLTEAGPIDGGRWLGKPSLEHISSTAVLGPQHKQDNERMQLVLQRASKVEQVPHWERLWAWKGESSGGICQQPFAASKEVTKKADPGSSQPCSRITWATDAGSWIQPSVTWSRSLLWARGLLRSLPTWIYLGSYDSNKIQLKIALLISSSSVATLLFLPPTKHFLPTISS